VEGSIPLGGQKWVGLEARTAGDRRCAPIALAVGPSRIASSYLRGAETGRYPPYQDHLAGPLSPAATQRQAA
jgi:hypothetical protein